MQGNKIHTCFLIISLLMLQTASAQILTKEELSTYASKTIFHETLAFYELNHFKFAWNEVDARRAFKKYTDSAIYYGLDPKDYSFNLVIGNKREDSLLSEINFSSNAIRFLKDLHVGNHPPEFRYDGIKFNPSVKEIAHALYFAIHQKETGKLIQSLQPDTEEYRIVRGKLRFYLQTLSAADFRDVRITSLKQDTSNHKLIARLKQTGITEPLSNIISDKDLEQEIIKAQDAFNLTTNGKMKAGLLAALNIPMEKRAAELASLLNTIRWYHSLMKESTLILINIPSASLSCHDNSERILEFKVILGQRSTPTPTLTSVTDEVILYPYWMVPYKIATRELLPRIKKNIHFLEQNNYQVLNKNGKIINPYSINWKSLHAGYFPYTLRQSTGCDNALGLVKFNFINPFSVFMHDTPGKNLFKKQQRFFSHGCIRLERPTELAHVLLGSNRIAIDTISEKGCLINQNPITLKAEKKANLAIVYNTAWVSQEGRIVFYEDIYRRLD